MNGRYPPPRTASDGGSVNFILTIFHPDGKEDQYFLKIAVKTCLNAALKALDFPAGDLLCSWRFRE
ncbi:MAG TPA: hypothetical protein DDZ34_06645 [Syntrophaceae bacterium]|nr:hypothetical protein [Syntrophaceae bacterium]